jgi:hypothetical protein
MRVDPICPRCGNALTVDPEHDTDPPAATVLVECANCAWRGVTHRTIPQPANPA